MTQTHRPDAPERPPLIRPGVRKLAWWLIGINVVLHGSFWLYYGLAS